MFHEWEGHLEIVSLNSLSYIIENSGRFLLLDPNRFFQKTVVGCPHKMSTLFASGLSVGVLLPVTDIK